MISRAGRPMAAPPIPRSIVLRPSLTAISVLQPAVGERLAGDHVEQQLLEVALLAAEARGELVDGRRVLRRLAVAHGEPVELGDDAGLHVAGPDQELRQLDRPLEGAYALQLALAGDGALGGVA